MSNALPSFLLTDDPNKHMQAAGQPVGGTANAAYRDQRQAIGSNINDGKDVDRNDNIDAEKYKWMVIFILAVGGAVLYQAQ